MPSIILKAMFGIVHERKRWRPEARSDMRYRLQQDKEQRLRGNNQEGGGRSERRDILLGAKDKGKQSEELKRTWPNKATPIHESGTGLANPLTFASRIEGALPSDSIESDQMKIIILFDSMNRKQKKLREERSYIPSG
ncbi:hypothetical protein B296_00002665 [Ensete ventricosum]|uniref:Uncharacterized protein n=1 Tax=Ensete ventricosum TaxID=4639 RepID=A0A426YBC4_ENSVE|nr:hypothetical protein B296_00002665 [Ensete ventricosum]